MKKFVGILLIPLVIAAVAVFILSMSAGKIIQAGVERLGSEIAQVDIELDGAHISFLSGSGGLEGLKIHNPEGYEGDHAFYAQHLALDIQPMSVFSDKIVIDEILIIGPDIQFEQRLKSSNLNKILQNVQAYMGPAGEAQETASGGKKLEIKRFVLQDANVGVGIGSKPVSITIPTIELTNLGSDQEGITAGEAMSLVFKEVTNQIIAEISKNPEIILKGGGDLLKNVGGSGGNAFKSLGGLFGESKNKEEENKEDP